VIRPDGKPLHPEDGWEDEGHPLTFQHVSAVNRKRWDGTATRNWQRIIIDHKRVASKDAAPLWSFCLVSDMARLAESVTHATALVYDFDAKGGRDFADVVDGLLGIKWFAHTTFSHTEEAHAFRLILPIAQAIPSGEYKEALDAVERALGLEGRDPACKDPSRLYYVPSCAPDAEPWLEYSLDGGLCDWKGWLEYKRKLDAEAKAREKAFAPPPQRRSRTEVRQSPEWERRRAVKAANVVLDATDPDTTMDEWLESIFSIVAALGEEGFQMIDTWSKRGAKYDVNQMKCLRRRCGLV
jgi:hypothetical protein